ncbi:MAG TPA: hypothetical protein VG651_09330 [Stellaceae bacterium]|nr:hypothetical protein [Stellaceae bacterium]
MNNIEIFTDYDMVVSITEKTVNDQIAHLINIGMIKPEFIVTQKIVGSDYEFAVLDSAAQVPRDKDGQPLQAYIDGQIEPRLAISQSGSSVTFVLNFQSGTAYLWTGFGPAAKLTRYDIGGWSYGINVNLDLKVLADDDKGKVPANIWDMLHEFRVDMFDVLHLFVDFESTDLTKFDPAYTTTKGSGDVGSQQLAAFMEFYLEFLVKTGSPYILGYSPNATPATKYGENWQVPDILRPVGTTFTVYHDPRHAGLSNLNFVLATKGGHRGILGSPGVFDTNWITPDEQCDAKMIYSHACLIEGLILQPFFNAFSNRVYAQVAGHINVSRGNDYRRARTAMPTGFRYSISEIDYGHDQYVNYYSVNIVNSQDKVDLNFSGHLAFYKEIDKYIGIDPLGHNCKAYAKGSIDWSGTISLQATKDSKGHATLALARAFRIDRHDADQHVDTALEIFSWIAGAIDKILGALDDFGLPHGLLEQVFDTLLKTPVPGIGDLSIAFASMGNSVANAVILPAGPVFFFKNPAADPAANLSLELTYKSVS